MLIERGQEIAGFDAVLLRGWLRQLRSPQSIGVFADENSIRRPEASDLIARLTKAGLTQKVAEGFRRRTKSSGVPTRRVTLAKHEGVRQKPIASVMTYERRARKPGRTCGSESTRMLRWATNHLNSNQWTR